jgi:hypothetical protein
MAGSSCYMLALVIVALWAFIADACDENES